MEMNKIILGNSDAYSVSADPGTEEVYQKVTSKIEASTMFDRWKSQQPQCKFGQDGVCCHVCGMGPCRIHSKAPKGICGATAETIVARNMLRHIVAGSAAYVYQAQQAARTLRETAKGKTGFQIKDEGKLMGMADKLNIDGKGATVDTAGALADLFYKELSDPSDVASEFVKAFAPQKRLKVWEKLGVIPGGPKSEIMEAMTRTMTHINTDPMELLLTAMRLSISAGYMGLGAAVSFQDILLGTPKVVNVDTNLGVLDPETVNILVHGHQPLLVAKVLEHSADLELVKKATDAGAKGIKIYGSTDVGQELLGRGEGGPRLAGQIGSWMKQEFAVATGAVDVMVLEFNCTIPGLKTMADKFHTKLLSVEPVLRMDGVETMPFVPEKADEQGVKIIEMAIEAYSMRDPKKINIPGAKSRAMVGFTPESVLDVLGGSLAPLIDAIVAGKIRGVAAVVGCTSLYKGKNEFSPLLLAEELVARDILVISSGCCASEIQHSNIMTPEGFEYCGSGLKEVCYSLGIPPVLSFGSCTEIHRIVELVTVLAETLNVDTSDLPIAVSAPEWMDEKSLVDGLFSVALGLFTHVAPGLPISGSSVLSKFLTHSESKRKMLMPEPATIKNLTGGEFYVETDPVRAARTIEYQIEKKRERLI